MTDLRQNKGIALTFSLLMLFLVVLFTGAYIMAVGNSIANANRVAGAQKAYYIADAGLLDAYERIVAAGSNVFASSTCANPSIPSSCTVPFIPSAANPVTDNGVYSVGGVNGTYKVSIVYSSVPRTSYTITSQGTYGNTSRTLQLQIMSSSISKFAYWSQTETNPTLGKLWWISGMLTTGPVQTNGQFNIMGNPVFNGATAEGASSPNYYYGTGTDPTSQTKSDPPYIFPQGLTNNAPLIAMPPPATLQTFQTAAGLTLTGASTIIFNANGTLTVTGVVKNSSGTVTTTYSNTTISPPAGGVIYVKSDSGKTDGNVTVQGTVKGQLTVAADQNIYISGNVTYNANPVTNPSSTDLVGLVANQNITVIEASAPAQLSIDAVLVALQGSFDVDQYSKDKDPLSNGTDGAVMDQFGSLVNYASGCTGVVNASGQLVGGWNQIQSYDNRLGPNSSAPPGSAKNLVPPGFPPLVNSLGQGIYTKTSITECFSGVCG